MGSGEPGGFSKAIGILYGRDRCVGLGPGLLALDGRIFVSGPSVSVSYTHLRAHETNDLIAYAVIGG